MRNSTCPYLIAFTLFIWIEATAQTERGPLTKRVIVKTNILNAVFQKPAVSVEKAISNTFSAELSFVQGHLENFLFADHYRFEGFLLRAKKYVTPIKYRQLNPYLAAYVGNLKRDIEFTGSVDNTGFFSIPSRDFHANSIRAGGSTGILFATRSNIVFDWQSSLGYGRYIAPSKSNPYDNAKGYVDLQIWLSIGYCF